MRRTLVVPIHVLLAALCWAGPAVSASPSYRLESPEDTLVGRIQTAYPGAHDTLLDVARRNGLGYSEIKLVNPGLDTWLPESDAEIVLPTEYVLPAAPKNGIVLNIPEMRLYYFRKNPETGQTEVRTFPIGIGREGWSTPYVSTQVIRKDEKPTWYPPESIRKEHAAKGDPLPRRVGPGPENPLGEYALRLALPMYLIHGTNNPWGVGMRVSHGCIRLYPEDIEELFSLVRPGTGVRIVNQPYKIGLRNGGIYLEAHPFLPEDGGQFGENLTSVVKLIVQATEDRPYEVDWELTRQVVDQSRGVPIRIGRIGEVQAPAVANVTLPAPRTRAAASGIELRLDGSLSDPVNQSSPHGRKKTP